METLTLLLLVLLHFCVETGWRRDPWVPSRLGACPSTPWGLKAWLAENCSPKHLRLGPTGEGVGPCVSPGGPGSGGPGPLRLSL